MSRKRRCALTAVEKAYWEVNTLATSYAEEGFKNRLQGKRAKTFKLQQRDHPPLQNTFSDNMSAQLRFKRGRGTYLGLKEPTTDTGLVVFLEL